MRIHRGPTKPLFWCSMLLDQRKQSRVGRKYQATLPSDDGDNFAEENYFLDWQHFVEPAAETADFDVKMGMQVEAHDGKVGIIVGIKDDGINIEFDDNNVDFASEYSVRHTKYWSNIVPGKTPKRIATVLTKHVTRECTKLSINGELACTKHASGLVVYGKERSILEYGSYHYEFGKCVRIQKKGKVNHMQDGVHLWTEFTKGHEKHGERHYYASGKRIHVEMDSDVEHMQGENGFIVQTTFPNGVIFCYDHFQLLRLFKFARGHPLHGEVRQYNSNGDCYKLKLADGRVFVPTDVFAPNAPTDGRVFVPDNSRSICID